MRDYFTLILIMATVIGFIVWVFIYTTTPSEIKNEGFTVGVITQFKSAGKTSGMDAIVEYIVNGVKYEVRTTSSAYEANVHGERFEVKYDKNNPAKSVVLTNKPVFLESESTGIEKGKITRLYRFAWGGGKDATNYAVEFEYIINGEKYKKSQELHPDYKEKYPELTKGKHYEVRYWVDNPERAIIHFDNPVE